MTELVTKALAEVPTAKPLPTALALSSRTTSAARELPNGRGFLRVVGSSGASSEPSEPSGPASPPATPVAAVASSSDTADVDQPAAA